MPTPALLNSMWQVKIVGRVEGQQTNNIFHFSCVGASSDVLKVEEVIGLLSLHAANDFHLPHRVKQSRRDSKPITSSTFHASVLAAMCWSIWSKSSLLAPTHEKWKML